MLIPISRVAESDSVRAIIARGWHIGRADEGSGAIPILYVLKRKVIGQVSEADSARVIAAGETRPVALVTETDTASSLHVTNRRFVDLTFEREMAFPIHRSRRSVFSAKEGERALPLRLPDYEEITEYDPDAWLVSATRALGSYVTYALADPDVAVEMSFPDTTQWTKETPLPTALIHFEQDDIEDVPIGFGTPGVQTYDYVNGYVRLDEAAQHIINFDVGVWVSAENGGGTKRMEIVSALFDLFTVAGNKVALNDATGGLQIVSFDGGRNVLDRINDLPVWRSMGMTLRVRVFSRYVPPAPDVLIGSFTQDPELTIAIDSNPNAPLTP